MGSDFEGRGALKLLVLKKFNGWDQINNLPS